MDEEKFRKAVQAFLTEYQSMINRVEKIITRLTKEAPVAKEDIPLAITLLKEEVEQSDLSSEHKQLYLLITGTLFSGKGKEITYVS